jgi:drug/metabolite transporter (DMT)-like permease
MIGNMATPEMAAIIYGLVSAVSWGAGDFSGGLATRAGSVVGVLFISYIVSVLLLTGCALGFGSPVPDVSSLVAGALAGPTGLIGLAALYRGLASGRMGIVAPLAAVTTAVLPILLGMFWEGVPSSLQMTGFLAAFAAIWLLSAPEKSHEFQWRQIALPITAGIFLGVSLILIDQAAEQSVLWSLVANRLTGLAVIVALLAVFRRGAMPAGKSYPMVCLAAVFDTGGYTFYALAARTGRLDTAAVLACMYPAATVILARLVLKERLSPRQWCGVMAALAALALIAA